MYKAKTAIRRIETGLDPCVTYDIGPVQLRFYPKSGRYRLFVRLDGVYYRVRGYSSADPINGKLGALDGGTIAVQYSPDNDPVCTFCPGPDRPDAHFYISWPGCSQVRIKGAPKK